jgi:pyruvate dehydrogenase phosphatase
LVTQSINGHAKLKTESRSTSLVENQNLYLKTPPYVSAEPVVTSTTIEPSKGDFMVIATDGLWEMLTNEEVVDLVGQWIDQQNEASPKNSIMAWLTSLFRSSLSVQQGGYIDKAGRVENGKGAKAIRQQQCSVQNKNAGRFVVEDKNAANPSRAKCFWRSRS